MKLMLAKVVATATLLSSIVPVAAMPPPLPSYSRYGPLLQCVPGYKIDVTAEEGVSARENAFTLINDRYMMELLSGAQEMSEGKWTDLTHPDLGQIKRFSSTPPKKRPDFYSEYRAFVAYKLPGVDGGKNLMVYSRQFKGTDADFTMLSRITKVDPAVDKCGTFGPPHYAGQDPSGMRWSRVPREGPGYRCQNGVGYATKVGEKLWLYWGPEPDPSISQLAFADHYYNVRGPSQSAKKIGSAKGPIAAGYKLTKQSLGAGISEFVLDPPNNDAVQPFQRQIFVQHSDAHEADARAFIDRLEFVSPKDKRCK